MTILFPSRSELLTPVLLTSAISERFPDVVVTAITVVEEAHCDTGSASTAARAVLDLDYAPGCDGGLPKRLVLKTVLVRPGAPSSLYRNEVRFYRFLREDVGVETPCAFASTFDEASGSFGILMEDVRLRSAKFPNASTSMTEPQTVDVLDQFAALHSRF